MQLVDRATMLAQLKTVNTTEHFIEKLYPLLLEHAGKEMNEMGLALVVKLAIGDYSAGMPPMIGNLCMLSAKQFGQSMCPAENAEIVGEIFDRFK